MNDSIANGKWQMGYLAAAAKTPEEFLSLFDYEDAKEGRQNFLIRRLGAGDEMEMAAIYETMATAYGRDFWRQLPQEYQYLFTGAGGAIEQYQNLGGRKGGLDYTALITGMRTYFQDYGTFNADGEWTIPVDPEVAEGAAESLQGQIDEMNLTAPVKLTVGGIGADIGSIAAIMGGMFRGHANGIPFVPFDGYPAILHRGERVMTAGANKNYTYHNNNYFGNVNLNNGLEIEQLTESIDRRSRRVRAGYGS